MRSSEKLVATLFKVILVLTDSRRINLVGLGGSGMLPLAVLLRQAGHDVQGSDHNLSDADRTLLAKNFITVVGNDPESNLQGVNCLVISSAVPAHSPIIRRARHVGLPVMRRSKALVELLAGRETVCVSGSHGKSTVTAMLVQIMNLAGHSFGHMLGARCARIPPADLGKPSSLFILEACEAHGSISDWCPTHAIITNLDDEHSSHYGGLQGLRDQFGKLLGRISDSGIVVVCGDDPIASDFACNKSPYLTYGFGSENWLRGERLACGKTSLFKDGKFVGDLSLNVPGNHNILNAMAAFSMAISLGVQPETALVALADFQGVDRRLQFLGEVSGVSVFDDFAHHPAEIEASLKTLIELRAVTAGRVLVVLEPQLHSRVSQLAPQFASALALADVCYLLPTQNLGETPHGEPAESLLMNACLSAGVTVKLFLNPEDLTSFLSHDLCPRDQVIVMAGRTGEGIAAQVLSVCDQRLIITKDTASVLYGPQRTWSSSFVESVRDRALSTPEAIAVEMGQRQLSYSGLLSRSHDLSVMLSEKGVIAGQSVGVCLGRSIDRVVAFFATLRIGAVYVPLDPELPAARLELMLQDAAVKVVVVNAVSPPLRPGDILFVSCHWLHDRSVMTSDDLLLDFSELTDPQNAIAYIIFTSGTTGRPKGVEISHAALTNYAFSASEHFAVDSTARVSLVSGFGFDVSIGDMALTLHAGACLVIPTDLQARPGATFARFVEDTNLTHLSVTPSLLGVMPEQRYSKLRSIIVAGEACPPSLLLGWGSGRTFINAYGPTEATVEATYSVCSLGSPITIGRPIYNMGACVIDEYHRVVPRGEMGELCLFGVGLARGYIGQPDLTSDCFVEINFSDQTKRRVYRTGDRAMLNEASELIFLGRDDTQIKIKGFRIELTEIESVLCEFEGIRCAVASVLDTPIGERLVAHVVLKSSQELISQSALKEFLLARLPAYMQPAFVLTIDKIPFTPNGKVDRSVFQSVTPAFGPRSIKQPKTETEKELIRLASEIKGGAVSLGVRESLYDLGFDSLDLASFLVSVESHFNTCLDNYIDLHADTIESIAIALDLRLEAINSQTQSNIPYSDTDRFVSSLRPFLASWPGERLGKNGLIYSLNTRLDHLINLVWCFQGGQEFAALSEALGARFNLFGLRSGHLVFDYSPNSLSTLTGLYADEIESLCLKGTLVLGGNCQGGLIAAEVSKKLRQRDVEVSMTVLMEQGRFTPLAGPVLLLFGAYSYLNPYIQMETPEKVFDMAYPQQWRIEMLPGGHGQYFKPNNVTALAASLTSHTKNLGVDVFG